MNNYFVCITTAAFPLSKFRTSLYYSHPEKNKMKSPWKIMEAEIFVSQTSWSRSPLWLVQPVYWITQLFFSPLPLIQSMFPPITLLADGKHWDTLCDFPKVQRNTATQNKRTNKHRNNPQESFLKENISNLLTFMLHLSRTVSLCLLPSTSHLFSVGPLRAIYR